jgi:hypothetical protein
MFGGEAMRGFGSAVAVGSVLMVVGGAVAQSPLEGMSTETHTSVDTSSNAAVMTAMRSPVTGEPYVAQKVTRSVWTLADGTKITHESDSKIARDAEGRVREAIENTNASSVGGTQMNRTSESVTIADPVEHTMTILTAEPVKMAMRMQLPNFAGLGKGAGGGGSNGAIRAILEDGPPPRVIPPPAPLPGFVGHGVNSGSTNPEVAAAMAKMKAEKDEVETEELGSDAIDGVRVTGKRTTTTIAAGKIGNDRPIVITHEEWTSPDLKVVVKSVDSDPRTGERTMVLEGLTVGDPDPALFKVPEGYTVQDMGEMMKSLGSLGQGAGAKQ